MLGIPSDEFGGQEHATAEKIKAFVGKYGLPCSNFTLLEKSCMNGPNMHPLVAIGKKNFPGDTGWNFADKYIFNKIGEVVARTKSVQDTLDEFMPLLDEPAGAETTEAAKVDAPAPAQKKNKTAGSAASVKITIQWCGG